MQPDQELLKQAVAAARAGREWTARDMFLRIVEINPKNEIAWMWLTGLLDDLDDRIHACQQILGINPNNRNTQQYLDQLLAEKQKILDEENRRAEERLNWARGAIQAGRKDSALLELRNLALNPQFANPEMWRLLAELSPELDERVRALERFVELVPKDAQAREELKQARHFLENPIHQAELYEEQGDIDKALITYRRIAANTDAKSKEWNRIYWKITELENFKHERIALVSPVLNIVRLTAGPPVVYFLFVLVHVGINPFAYPDPISWLGLVWVTLGSFMVALAAVRSHHRLWALVFRDVGAKGTPATRRVMSFAGWMLVILPHLVLFASAAYRMLNYTHMLQ
jgi:tetratricopeptide (TPR) repeat protein